MAAVHQRTGDRGRTERAERFSQRLKPVRSGEPTSEGAPDVTTDTYYNTSWQVLEERDAGAAGAAATTRAHGPAAGVPGIRARDGIATRPPSSPAEAGAKAEGQCEAN